MMREEKAGPWRGSHGPEAGAGLRRATAGDPRRLLEEAMLEKAVVMTPHHAFLPVIL